MPERQAPSGLGPMIQFLTLLVVLFAGLAQSGRLPRRTGYSLAGGVAAIVVVLALARYKQRKDRGE